MTKIIISTDLTHHQKYFKFDCFIFIKNDTGTLEYQSKHRSVNNFSENDRSIANWVFKNSIKAGKNTDTLPSSDYTFFPLMGNNSTIGGYRI